MILRGASEDEALREIVRLVAGITGAQYTAIVTPSGGGETALHRGLKAGRGRTRFLDVTSPVGEGVSGWALQHREIAASTDVNTDPRYDTMRGFAKDMNYSAAVAVPIVLEDDVLAALAVGYREPREFSQDEISTLNRIAHQAAIAVGNARQRESLANPRLLRTARRAAAEPPSR